jgi:uncharacterized iron-regulated protein
MIDEGKTAALQAQIAAAPRDAAALGAALDWQDSGWPDWSMYQPIAQEALDAGLPIRAANLSPEGVRAVAKDGWLALAPDRVNRLALTTEPSEETRQAMTAEMKASHCGLLPEESIAPMLRVQRARDGIMAEAMAKPSTDGAVLIAGVGHVRKDRGVPWYLALLDKAPTVVVAFMEVVPGHDTPDRYRQHFDGKLPFDYVWFTAAVPDVDHCASLRDRMKALGKPAPS